MVFGGTARLLKGKVNELLSKSSLPMQRRFCFQCGLSVCFKQDLFITYETNFRGIWWQGAAGAKEEPITSQHGSDQAAPWN